MKKHLGLDDERSWVVLSEFNASRGLGFDLRPIKSKDGRVDYDFLPPRFFEQLIAKIHELEQGGDVVRTPRDE